MKFPVTVNAKKNQQKSSVSNKNYINKLGPSQEKMSSVLLPSSEQTDTGPNKSSKQDLFLENTIETDLSGSSPAVFSKESHVKNCILPSKEEAELCEARKQSSRASSIYEDSGFNSSASEDRDDIEESLLHLGSDYDKDKNLENERSAEILSPEGDSLNMCEETGKSVASKNSQDAALTTDSSSLIVLNKAPGLIPLNKICKHIDLNNGSGNNRKSSFAVQNSLSGKSDLSVLLRNSSRPQNPRRRCQKDHNNNDTSSTNFRSYLGKPPVKLSDCFQNKGLLMFAACIVYTLMLFFLCGILCTFMESIKYAVKSKNLKEMRNNTAQSRHARTSANSG